MPTSINNPADVLTAILAIAEGNATADDFVVPQGPRRTKAQAITAYLAEHPEASRREVAEAVGCTPQRVGEVVRAGLTVQEPPAPTTRSERCEHERARHTRTGSCGTCPTFKSQS